MVKALKKLALAVSYARHPVGVTCLDCGFLAMGDEEVSLSNRILLHCRGSAGCPPLEEIRCFRSLWVDYDLAYVGTNADGIFDEILMQRRHCPGFFRYKPSWSPKEHQDLLLKSEERKEKIWGYILATAVGALGTLLVQYIAKHLGLKAP